MKDKTPSLSEVKEYFKDADKIQSIIGRKFKNDGKFRGSKYAMDGDTSIYAKNGKYEVWNQLRGYAKILSYKEPKEKTYKITREQLEKLHRQGNDYTKFDIEYLFPEVVETKLTVGKWYWRYNKKELAVWNDRDETYGFNTSGKFLYDYKFSKTNGTEIEADEQEVMMALNKECERLGIKTGAYIKDVVTGEIVKIDDNYRYYANNRLKHLKHTLFHEGKFAEIIPTLTKQEAEAKLNCKIV